MVQVDKTSLDGVLVITPQVFGDNRGWFSETYSSDELTKHGIDTVFVQDNQSFSAIKNTFRGIHFQKEPYAQTKLVRCIRGKILDIAVDLRKDSPTYLKSVAIELSEENKKQIYIPRGFGHGFLTLTDDVEICYKVDRPYNRECDRSVSYCDPSFDLSLPDVELILSDKDKNAPLLKDSDCEF